MKDEKKKSGRPKKYDFIPPDCEKGAWVYGLLNKQRESHPHFRQIARIALCWFTAKPGGELTKTMLPSGPLKDMTDEWDVIIALDYETFQSHCQEGFLTGVMEHAVMHVDCKRNADGNPSFEPDGTVAKYKIRKHDVEEFKSVLELMNGKPLRDFTEAEALIK